MCEVIKIRLKGRMRGKVGKETTKKEIDNKKNNFKKAESIFDLEFCPFEH